MKSWHIELASPLKCDKTELKTWAFSGVSVFIFLSTQRTLKMARKSNCKKKNRGWWSGSSSKSTYLAMMAEATMEGS
jgi:hypothetical protein